VISKSPQALTIGAFARSAGVNVETIRFYQRKGLLPPPHKPPGGIRRYGAAEVRRVRFIKSAQRLGFSLDAVADLLRLEDGTHCRDARELGRRKLADVRARIVDLLRIESRLVDLVDQCGVNAARVRCPLVEALEGEIAIGLRVAADPECNPSPE
jgi:MerR family mercuric resistance operon transcriptional regulator